MARARNSKERKTLTLGSKFAIATSAAKRAGHSDFSEGSSGDKARDRIAEGIASKNRIVSGKARKRRSRY